MTPRLKRIFGRSVRAFEEPFSVDLPDTGLVQVRAINADTKGSSGSGKSTLLTVPAAALGFGPPSTKLLSWFPGADPLQVGVDIQVDAKTLTVTRGDKLTLKVDGVAAKGKAESKEDKLEEELVMPFDVISTLSYRRQGQGSIFLGLADDKKKVFLAEPVGVEAIESRLEEGKKRVEQAQVDAVSSIAAHTQAKELMAQLGPVPEIAALKTECQRTLIVLQRAEAALEQAREAYTGANEAYVRDRDTVIMAKKAERAEKWRQAGALQAKLKIPVDPAVFQQEQEMLDDVTAKLAEARKWLATTQQEDAKRKADASRAMAEYRVAAGQTQEAKREIPVLLKDLEREKHEEAHLVGNVPKCPTCQKDWPEGGAKHLEVVQYRIGVLTEILQNLQPIADAIHVVPEEYVASPRIETLNKVIASLSYREAQISTAKEYAVLNAQKADRDAYAAALAAYEEADRQMNAAETTRVSLPQPQELWDLESQVKLAMMAHSNADVTLKAAQQSVDRHTKADEILLGLFETKQTAITTHAELADAHEAVKAFVSKVFDEMLLEAADETNQILADVPNVRGCVLSYRSEVLTKEGKVSRRAIVPVLSIDGHEIGLQAEEGASGGMLAVVKLAVDLGVLQAIERRIGHKLGWLVLDEPFEGLDAPCREACVEILRHQAQDRLVLVVDHFAEIAGLFDRTITVQHKDGRATVQ